MRTVAARTIDAAPAAVWQVVADTATHTSWRPALIEFTQVSDGQLAVGTRIRERLLGIDGTSHIKRHLLTD